MAQSPIPTYTTQGGVTFDGVFRFDVGEKFYYLTQNMDPSVSVDDEDQTETYDLIDGTRLHYRTMNPFRSRFAAAIVGIKNIWVRPGSLLYIGNDASMVTISHISDIVGSAGMVYVVGPAQIERNSLLGELGSKRSNVTCIDGVASSPIGYKETIGNIRLYVVITDEEN
ncbi:probable mediator of RNA polymerase II transcription subunit 36b [Tanacetum coccineum]